LLYDISFIDADTGWAVGEHGTILRTIDGGNNWTAQTSGTPFALSSVHFADVNYGTAVGDIGTILRTTNGGELWTPQSSGTSNFLFSTYFTDVNTGWTTGTRGLIIHTTDGGNNWLTQSTGTTLYGIYFSDDSSGWSVGDLGRIVHTADGGNSWAEQTSGTTNTLKSVHFVDNNAGWAVGNVGTILQTVDGGNLWSEQVGGTTTELESVHFADTNNGWSVGALGVILHTTDGGNSWVPQTSGTSYSLTSVRFVDADNGWVAGGSGTILHTINGGIEWTQQSSGAPTLLRSIYFINTLTGWAAGSSGTIVHTTDGGNLWIAQSSGTTNSLYSACFTSVNTGWVVGNEGTILQTTDGGNTWTQQSSGTTSLLYSVHFTDANIGWTVGEEGVILHTTDGGVFWRQQSSATTNSLYSVAFNDANYGWAVGEGGTILHTSDGGTGIAPPQPTTLASPGNGSTVSISPTLEWNPAPGALWYTLQVSTSPYFITYVENRANIVATSVRVTGLETKTVHYWRVSVTDDSGTSGWSEVWNFMTASARQVDLVSPLDGVVITTDSVILVWRQSFPFVDRYWVETDTDSLFGTSQIDSLVTDTTYTLSSLQHNQNVWWRVRGHNLLGWGEFSEVRSFLVFLEIPMPPTLLSPLDGATGISTSPTLVWTPSPGAESYSVQLSDTADFSRLVVDEVGLTTTSHDITGISIDAVYYWRVGASNGLGTSDWSEVWSFSTNTTGVSSENRTPQNFQLRQNYPNPFNPSTVIRYTLPQRAHVRLGVYNLAGEEVSVLVDAMKDAGFHEVSLDATSLASGVYFYRLAAGMFLEIRKLLILR
jgi:photosystem II stability/assembly factor-like uncharacterized protein